MDQPPEEKIEFTVGNIISQSFESFKENITFYTYLGLIVILLITTVITLFPEEPDFSKLLTISLILVLVAFYTKFAVTIHRSILLNEVSIRYITYWSNNETLFMQWGMGMVLAIISIVTATVFILTAVILIGGPFFTIGAIIAFAILSSRLAILFPSIAVGKKLSLSECWNLTGQHKASMFGLVIGFPFATNIILKLIPEEGLLWLIVGTTASVIVTILEIIIISHAYNALVVNLSSEDKLSF